MKNSSVEGEAKRSKRLGQVFTGERLARLLAALARAHEAHTVIDPMAGSGDMLAACLEMVSSPKSLSGIEIDRGVFHECQSRLKKRTPSLHLIHGNAFDPFSWKGIPHAWDLVITNPPYVRYQLGNGNSVKGMKVPSATEVRGALIECLSTSANLEDEERSEFLACANHYSGLADLALPSWLLCCARVAVGGRLAIVVPNTWLSRDYAAPVLYILRRFFEIEYVVDDADMAWFPDVLARTTLVVAKRTADKQSPYLPGGHLHISLPRKFIDETSLVGKVFSNQKSPERSFARWAEKHRKEKKSGADKGIQFFWSDEHDIINTLRHAAEHEKWIPKDVAVVKTSTSIPEQIQRVLTCKPRNLTTLSDLGWTVGQGLRTGANDFFYVALDPRGTGYQSPLLPGEILDFPAEVLKPAIRRQSELPMNGRITPDQTQSYVLLLENWALPDDIEAAEGPRPWKPMTGDLVRVVMKGAATTYKRQEKSVFLPNLSAVRTNVRAGIAKPPRPARFWYHLPPLAPRHIPDIFLPRVNGSRARAYLNHSRSIIIDANFSAFWPTDSNAIDAHVLFALLSSSWAAAYLEATGTVLGGGALKIEATHLRRLLLPRPDDASAIRLAELTKNQLIEPSKEEFGKAVDDLVFKILRCTKDQEAIKAFAEELLLRRTK